MELDDLKRKLDAVKHIGKPVQIVIDYDGNKEFWTTEKYKEVSAQEYLELRKKK
jgi:hypothetical protein